MTNTEVTETQTDVTETQNDVTETQTDITEKQSDVAEMPLYLRTDLIGPMAASAQRFAISAPEYPSVAETISSISAALHK